jgi:uncharacterized protein (UPF0332 family)
MSPYPRDLWERACNTYLTACRELTLDPDTSASCAYYAAFYAVSALLALEGKEFTRHSAVESAVHRDLVKPGIWPVELGSAYTRLSEARNTADYGANRHVPPDDAHEAVRAAERILRAVSQGKQGDFPLPAEFRAERE